jgi:Chalcone isomerase-like
MQPHIPLRRTLLLAAFAAPWLAGPSAQAAPAAAQKIAGVRFEGGAQVAGQELRLNGVGVRAVAWFKGYAAGLYLARATSDAGQAMAATGAKRVQMRMLVDVPTEEFVKAFHKGVARNVPAAGQAALVSRMAQFDQAVRAIGQVKKGDVINLDYLPTKGLLLVVNGRLRGDAIPGADLYAALMAVFLGAHPVDDKLKAGLLGAPPA